MRVMKMSWQAKEVPFKSLEQGDCFCLEGLDGAFIKTGGNTLISLISGEQMRVRTSREVLPLTNIVMSL